MQIQSSNPDGSDLLIERMPSFTDNQHYLDLAVDASKEGKLVICGDHLDEQDVTTKVFNIFACDGVIRAHNLTLLA